MSNIPQDSYLKGKTATDITDEIMQQYELHGNEDYDGEPVSQASHMIQCAMQAMRTTDDVEVILGAFLHDIGHLLKHAWETEAMGDYGVVNHEWLGAQYLLERGFSERICAIVGMHVHAKRYLVTTSSDYARKLSDASWQTLHFQGGLMTEYELKQFEKHLFFDDVINVRLWDDAAKDTAADLLPLHDFRNLVLKYLNEKVHEKNS